MQFSTFDPLFRMLIGQALLMGQEEIEAWTDHVADEAVELVQKSSTTVDDEALKILAQTLENLAGKVREGLDDIGDEI